jgi:hypothetical protein
MKPMIGTGVLVGLIVLGSAQELRAADDHVVTVQELYQRCRAIDAADVTRPYDVGLCDGYISGVGDMYLTKCHITASYGAMAQSFMNWAPAHPQDWLKPQLYGVLAALSSVWLCRVG